MINDDCPEIETERTTKVLPLSYNLLLQMNVFETDATRIVKEPTGKAQVSAALKASNMDYKSFNRRYFRTWQFQPLQLQLLAIQTHHNFIPQQFHPITFSSFIKCDGLELQWVQIV